MRRRFFTSLSGFTDYESADLPGFTDIVSNAVFLPDLAPLENSEKLRNGSLDLDDLPSLLHESTHHACFDSVVGCSLASLFASCFSLWTLSIGEDTLGIAARDLIVLRTAYLLLQPLVEGMALFAEHDMITGTSPVISKMTQHALALFTKGRIQHLINIADPATVQIIKSGKGDVLMSRAHTYLLEQVRQGQTSLERKTLLLSQPVDGPYRYLLGYLAVKGMYRTLSQNCPALKDPEVFMLVVRQQFFGDEDLAQILLRFYPKSDDPVVPYLQIGQDVADVLNRFQDRMDELYRNTGEVSKSAVEPLLKDSGRRGLYGEEKSSPGTEFPPDLSFQATLRTVGMINVAWPRLLKHRSDFRFSFQAVEITVAENGIVVIRHKDTEREYCLMARAVEKSRRGTFSGSIEALRLRDFRVVVCILAEEGLVAVFDCETRQWNPPDLCLHLDDLPSAVAVEGAMHAFYDWQQHQSEKKAVREVLDDYEQQAKDAVGHLYAQLFLRKPDDERTRIMSALACGLGAVFEDDALRDRVAKITLLTGCGATVAAVAAALGVTPEDLRSEVTSLNEISQNKCGLAFFEFGQSDTISSIESLC